MPGLVPLVALLLAPCSAPTQELPFEKEVKAFRESDRQSPPEKGQIVFIGSSSFTRWTSLSEAFPGYRVLNRAFGGSSLPDVTRYLNDVVFPYSPCQVVLYCGENDFAGDEKLVYDTVVARFKTLFSAVRKRLPKTSFAYVSMKPSPSRWALAPKFIAANAAIKEYLSTQARTAYVDVWPVMLGQDGMPKAEIFVEDRLHMNADGYTLWAPLISKVLDARGRR